MGVVHRGFGRALYPMNLQQQLIEYLYNYVLSTSNVLAEPIKTLNLAVIVISCSSLKRKMMDLHIYSSHSELWDLVIKNHSEDQTQALSTCNVAQYCTRQINRPH